MSMTKQSAYCVQDQISPDLKPFVSAVARGGGQTGLKKSLSNVQLKCRRKVSHMFYMHKFSLDHRFKR